MAVQSTPSEVSLAVNSQPVGQFHGGTVDSGTSGGISFVFPEAHYITDVSENHKAGTASEGRNDRQRPPPCGPRPGATDRPGAERVELPYGSGQRMSLKSESNNPSNQDERREQLTRDREPYAYGQWTRAKCDDSDHVPHQTPARIRQHGVLLSSWIAPRLRFLFPTSLPQPKKSRHTCGTPAPIGSGMPGIKFRAGRRNFVKT